ncbi:MAG TPA: peptide deformylase [Limnochordia bacterium]|nr:peptide deformylase [Limnochordia bacterium]
MAVLPLRFEGDPVLRAKARPVAKVTKRIQKLLKDMEETMYAADGVGLAAPQVGVLERLIVVDAGEGPIHIVNPVLEKGEGTDIDREGCLSIPGVYGYVERYARVVVSGLDPKGKPIRIDGDGLLARVLQHEIDHLDGILFIDKATGLYRVTEEDREGGAHREEPEPESLGEKASFEAGDPS